MAVRLHEIAARAQVSTATVSRVLNGRPGVSPVARDAVLAAIDVLGYERPARVRTTSTGLIGLVVPELTNPYFTLITQAIETDLANRGYTTVLCTQTLMTAHEDDYVRILLDRGVAGIIFVAGIHAVAGTNPRRYTALRERSVPIVLVHGYLPTVDAPFISNDDAAVSDLGVRHLASIGHRRIGLATGPDRYTTVRRRIDGFHDAMRRHLPRLPDDPPTDQLIACTRFVPEGGREAAGILLERGVTGILCGSDLMALGAIREVRARGLRVPEDVSVVGSDDSPLLEYTDPPLTTVRQDVEGMAAAAVRALLDEINGTPAPRAEYVFRPELVVRGSTAPPPSANPHPGGADEPASS
jgi:LacI family repressor for deo operon, udp, cdd, tsx, nupC, and nupG